MRQFRTMQQPWWPGCLLLVLILIGHDGLMASEARAASTPHITQTAHDQVLAGSPEPIMVSSGDDEAPAGHPSACGVVGAAMQRAIDGSDTLDLGEVGAFVCGDLSRKNQLTGDGSNEPFWPPGTRRALLQIFRI